MNRKLPTSWVSLVVIIWLAVIGGLSSLGQFARLMTPWGRLSAHEIAMGLFVASVGVVSISNIWHSQHWRLTTKWRHSPWLWWAGWVVWTWLTTVVNSYIWHSPGLLMQGSTYLARTVLYVLFAGTLWQVHRRHWLPTRTLTFGLAVWLGWQAVIGLGQYLFLPDSRLFKLLGWDDHFNRAFGTLFDPGFFGLITALGLLWFGQHWQSASKHVRWAAWGVVVSGWAVILSYSRASYLALLVGLVMYVWSKPTRSVFVLLIALLIGIWLAPKDGGGEGQKLLRTNSVAAREEVMVHHARGLTWEEILAGRGWYYEGARQLQQQGINLDAGRPLVNQSVGRNNAQSVDNLYLHVFFSTGIIGTILFLLGLYYWVRPLWPLPFWRATLSTILLHSCFSTSLLYPWTLLLIAFFLCEQPSSNDKK